MDAINQDPRSNSFRYYRGSPHGWPNRVSLCSRPTSVSGEDAFRRLQRKANPLKLSLFSIIGAQHSRWLDCWGITVRRCQAHRILRTVLCGKTRCACRRCSRLCSLHLLGDFNDWIRKNVSVDYSQATCLARV